LPNKHLIGIANPEIRKIKVQRMGGVQNIFQNDGRFYGNPVRKISLPFPNFVLLIIHFESYSTNLTWWRSKKTAFYYVKQITFLK